MATRERNKTAQLNLRIREPLRARIETAAKDRGVSMNSEMSDRLERSFLSEEEVWGGRHIFVFLKSLAAAIAFVEERRGKKFLEDAETLKDAVATISGILGVYGIFSPERMKTRMAESGDYLPLVAARAALKIIGVSDETIRDQYFGMAPGTVSKWDALKATVQALDLTFRDRPQERDTAIAEMVRGFLADTFPKGDTLEARI